VTSLEAAPRAARAATLLVISPHCDDAVLSCGDLIRDHPGASVVTLFAGGPASYGEPSDWDRRAGFAPGDDVMAARRAEDAAALAVLGAVPRWLAHRDSQYGTSPPVTELARDLRATLAATTPDIVALPLGLFHSDHALAHAAALAVFRRDATPDRIWLAYADAIYRRLPGLVADRLAHLRRDGVCATTWLRPSSKASLVKRRAIACYASQLRALTSPGRPGARDACAAERYWRLEERGEGR
jgi:LmbE family N-acetylglucosaminyl deacetylase